MVRQRPNSNWIAIRMIEFQPPLAVTLTAKIGPNFGRNPIEIRRGSDRTRSAARIATASKSNRIMAEFRSQSGHDPITPMHLGFYG